MHVLVTGNKGMLGRDLVPGLKDAGFHVTGVDIKELDITRFEYVRQYLMNIHPDMVINCAAYTAVDRAESEPDLAFAVNRDGPANLARACQDMGTPLIHISTDYVFDGNGDRPYREEDAVNPIGIYGKSKWEGERSVRSYLEEHLIVRTAWLYGVYGKNFVKTMLKLCKEKDEFTVVNDQKGCPTWTGDLAHALVQLVKRFQQDEDPVQWGTYHFCGQGSISWHEFACTIVEEAAKRESIKPSRVIPIPTCDYPTPAKRPLWSVMDCSKIQNTFNIQPLYWKDGLVQMLDSLYSVDRDEEGIE